MKNKKSVKNISKSKDLIEKLNIWFTGKRILIFSLSLISSVVFGLLLFNPAVSIGGDDSTYIVNAKNFIEGISFPTHLGAGYPVFLGLVMSVVGVNLVFLKFVTFLFFIGHVLFMYFAFRNRIKDVFLLPVLLLISVNYFLLTYASLTYSESMFMFIQAACFYLFFKLVDRINDEGALLEHWKLWLLFGFVSFYLSLTRMVGYSFIITVIAFFIIEKRWKAILIAFGSYLLFAVPFKIYQAIVWGASQTSRVQMVLMKNVYNKAQGTEDFNGMMVRFFENAKGYLSKHVLIILGFKDEFSTDKSVFLTILVVVLLLGSLYFAFKRLNKYMTMIGLYLGAAISITFITLQQSWDQGRLIMIYVPLMLILISYGIYELSKKKGFKFLQYILLAFLVIVFFKTLGVTIKKAGDNQEVLTEHLQGNKYYGFTPDWVNFLRMSEWAAENVPENSKIASRKPSMSFIYGNGKPFYGIYRFPYLQADSAISICESNYNNLVTIKTKDIDLLLKGSYEKMLLKQNTRAVIGKGNDLYSLIGVEDSQGSVQLKSMLAINNVNYYNSVDSFKLSLAGESQTYGVMPDSLLFKLKENDVDYIIMASLRINPKMKTERTINTVQRYMYFIEIKYPGIFKRISKYGTDEQEPATLFEIQYDRYGLK